MRLWCVVFLLFFTLCLEGAPDVQMLVSEKPAYVVLSQSGRFVIDVKNVGGSEAYQVQVLSEEGFVTVEAPKVASLGKGSSVQAIATVSSETLPEGEHSFTLEATWKDGEGEVSSSTKKISFSVRKPTVRIERVEAGLLPGKIRIRTDEKKRFSVAIRNQEEARLGGFSLVFSSSYLHYTILREGVVEEDIDGKKFTYAIDEYFSPGDMAEKNFELAVSLPEGTTSARFTLDIALLWNGYVIDTSSVEVVVGSSASG